MAIQNNFVVKHGLTVLNTATINQDLVVQGSITKNGVEVGYGYTGSQGNIGYTGSQGTTGYVGSQGIQGIQGYTGSQGVQGIQGYTGSQGIQGLAGYVGSQGIQGSQGYTGSKGDTGLGFAIAKTYTSVAALTADTAPTGIVAGQFAIIDNGNANDPENSRLYLWNGTSYQYTSDLSGAQGIQGPAGAAGANGYTGSQGIQGVQGIQGYTGSAGTNGYTGSAGTNGYTGSRGYTGSQGSQGTIGYTGSQGTQGTTGYTGSVGAQGTTGYTGSVGAQGTTGYTGSQGADGAQGTPGYTGSAGPSNVINSTSADFNAHTFLHVVGVESLDQNSTPKSSFIGTVPIGITSMNTFGIGTTTSSQYTPLLDIRQPAANQSANLAIRADTSSSNIILTGGTYTSWISQSPYAAGISISSDLEVGSGTGKQAISVSAGDAGAGSGAVLQLKVGTGNTHRIGNYSAALGGAFDANLSICADSDKINFVNQTVRTAWIDSSANLLIGYDRPAPVGFARYLDVYNLESTSTTTNVTSRLVTLNTAGTSQAMGILNKKRDGSFVIENSEQSASGNIQFTINGSEKARFTSTGNFGVGTTAPNAKVHGYQSASFVPTNSTVASLPAFLAEGSYGGGYIMKDGAYYLGTYSVSGTYNIGLGSSTGLVNAFTVDSVNSTTVNPTGSTSGVLNIKGAAGYDRTVAFKTASAMRWQVGATAAAESGSNVGSNLAFHRYNDAGAWIGASTIYRYSGEFAFEAAIYPQTDNNKNCGTASLRWSVVYAGTGSINTSDAREKTAVRSFEASEIAAAKLLSKEIGAFKFLSAIAEKGDAAREHIGLTVQRAIEIMESQGLVATNYGFICYDEWDQQTETIPAVEAKDAVLDAEGNVIEPAVEAKPEEVKVIKEAGSRYGFRYDELNQFIIRGLAAQMEEIEARLASLGA